MDTNKSVIRVVTTTLAILAGICVLAICTLSYLQVQIPPELNTLTGTLVGYIGGSLVKTSPTSSTPPDTHPTPTPQPPPDPDPNP